MISLHWSSLIANTCATSLSAHSALTEFCYFRKSTCCRCQVALCYIYVTRNARDAKTPLHICAKFNFCYGRNSTAFHGTFGSLFICCVKQFVSSIVFSRVDVVAVGGFRLLCCSCVLLNANEAPRGRFSWKDCDNENKAREQEQQKLIRTKPTDPRFTFAFRLENSPLHPGMSPTFSTVRTGHTPTETFQMTLQTEYLLKARFELCIVRGRLTTQKQKFNCSFCLLCSKT